MHLTRSVSGLDHISGDFYEHASQEMNARRDAGIHDCVALFGKVANRFHTTNYVYCHNRSNDRLDVKKLVTQQGRMKRKNLGSITKDRFQAMLADRGMEDAVARYFARHGVSLPHRAARSKPDPVSR